ncbi:MAG: NAD-dependent epimerase/dehydratase family protein [Chromatiaceae bacterium]|nr:NAD-dependent epimerase/dehydratase family protein [Chromatiaceae bacterium]
MKGVPTLVTGATGKVGRHLVTALLERGADVCILTRDPERALSLWSGSPLGIRVADLTDFSTLDGQLDGIELVFHLASYSPAPKELDVYQASAHWPVTAQGTRNLLDASLSAGIRRLIYVSSVKVMGAAVGAGNEPMSESTPPEPDTLYGRAKLEAERSVLAAGESEGMHVGVLRAPMIYGLPGEGNIARMIDAVARNRFPPWPKIENRRSAVHVLDLIAAMLLAATHPQATGRCYLVTDGNCYSTRWLYEKIRLALDKPVPGWTVPYWALSMAAAGTALLEKLIRRRLPFDREGLRKLTGDACFSSDRIRAELGFESRHNLNDEIRYMVGEYLKAAPKVP